MIQEAIGPHDYLFTGDVAIEIQWLIHEQDRYESDAAPDVDNILKPLLDSLCDPKGILIDDCQVQSVSCSWIDWTSHGEQVQIRLQFRPDEWLSRKALHFIHLGGGLCFPMNRTIPPSALLLIIDHVDSMRASRDALLESGHDYYRANMVMPIQRMFHRSRVGKFPVTELPTIRAELVDLIALERDTIP